MYDVPAQDGIKEVVINGDVIKKKADPVIVYEKEKEAESA